ncbi:MAG: dipeptidase [Chitinophagales bacterium]|nr:dipeptidase [Chitinophagales bacterium]MDW8394385.1 dipeptidase [Chitinophagales bacterium]
MEVRSYLQQHQDRFLDELFGWLRIPSVSADPKFRDDVFEAAEYVRARLEEAGADNCRLIPTKGFPVVFAEKRLSPELPTVLVYGHYDVQPADPYDLWQSPPFEPEVRNGKIYARGACDDKGQSYMHVKAFELMMKTGQLPCNVKFMLEGEEEVGSVHLEGFLKEHKDLLKADVVLVSDTAMISLDCPSVTIGLRGLCYFEVEVTGPNRDLHSGTYGGAVANPIQVLARMITALKDERLHITIPGFYDDVIEYSSEQRAEMAQRPFDLEAYKKELGIHEVEGEAGYSTLERTTIRPTVECNGIWGGYTGAGAKTVLPSKAYAKISCRLVANQQPERIAQLFTDYFLSLAPRSVQVKVHLLSAGHGVIVPTDSLAYRAAALALEHTFGKKPIPTMEGGSIPVVASFEKILGLKTALMGFGLDTDALHSPNENFGVANYFKGIETIPFFYHYFTQLSMQQQK